MPQERIYFDNAATTPLDPIVVEEMIDVFNNYFGNPSSLYSYGREAKMRIELARKKVAQLLNVQAGEIFFTSGGTESINSAVHMALCDLNCKAIITSEIEHSATLNAIQDLGNRMDVPIHYLNIKENGHVDLDHLNALLADLKVKTYVSLMHANNEIGNIMDVEKAGAICHQHGAIFHCDTVQTISHYPVNLKDNHVHFASGAAHKFHGPKGVGLLFINSDIHVKSMLKGGGQERNMRAGTENISGIVALAKALEISLTGIGSVEKKIEELKQYFISQIQKEIPEITFNGDWDGACLYNVINLRLPYAASHNMLFMNLDIKGVCVSGGSACSSGSQTVSHVIKKVYPDIKQTPMRISFSKYNTKEEVDRFIKILKETL